MEENTQENIDNAVQEETDVVLEDVNTQQPIEAHKYNAAEINMANLRASKDKAEKERAIMSAQLDELKKQQEDVRDYGDEDLIEGKHLKKEVDSVKRQLEEYKVQQMANADESRLKSTYTDFDSVVNSENLEKLKSLDPETSETIATSNASIYTRGAAAYKRIKELNLIVEDNHEKDRDRTHANASLPRAMNSVSPQTGDGPLSMANAFSDGLTPDMKKQLWKEMQDIAKKH